MTQTEKLQKRHDDLIKEIEEVINKHCVFTERTPLLNLVNRYGQTCISLVESEYAETKA